jgi:uncharacterized membrane protein
VIQQQKTIQRSASTTRYPLVDTLRGVAIVLMIAYHFSFDLNYYRVLNIDFNHAPFWLGARVFIVSLFLGLVGVSLHLATARGLNTRRYLRRLLLLLVCAGLVSLASYQMFPLTFIYFGILHFIAAASVLGLVFTRLYWTNLLLGGAVIAAGLLYHDAAFDSRLLGSIGFMTYKPLTEDYVPLAPWFGVVLIGMFLGRSVFARTPAPAWVRWHSAHPLARLLAFGGRHSLLIYMLHQPVLLGVLYLIFGKV